MEFNLNIEKLGFDSIYIKDILLDKSYFISNSIYDSILNNEDNYLKLVTCLMDDIVTNIVVFNNQNKVLEINKILFLESLFKYFEKNNETINKELLGIYHNLNYKYYVKKDEVYNLNIDNKDYSFKVLDFYNFLELSDEDYNKVMQKGEYLSSKIEYFVYSLISYFRENNLFSKYVFDNKIMSRITSLLTYQDIDFEFLNKMQVTKDNLLGKIEIDSSIKEILNIKYDNDKLQNIIKCYINLCKTFNYDEVYYLDEVSSNALKHNDYHYISKISKENNKLVCFEFTSIFGYYLNQLGINYEVVGSNDYGIHSFLIFRYDKYLIKVEAIRSVFDNDLTNVRIHFPLTGIECINQNNNTKDEFNKILDICYKSNSIDFRNDYLPSNKIDNSNNIETNSLNDYILKIDLIFKKIKDLNLSVIDKLSYFKILIKLVFTTRELEMNVFYTTLTNDLDIIFVIALNKVSYQNLDNTYIIYENNNLSIINKDDLENKIRSGELKYLTSKEIPGINKVSMNKK